MGRRKTIDREAVLEAAESLIAAQGSASLTIDGVAKAAGITKGGVQSCFGNKESLIQAMLARNFSAYRKRTEIQDGSSSSTGALLKHINITSDPGDDSNARAAALMAALLQSPEYLSTVQEWYQEIFTRYEELAGEEGERARILFFANEGLFFLRYFKLMKFSDDNLEQYFTSLKKHLTD